MLIQDLLCAQLWLTCLWSDRVARCSQKDGLTVAVSRLSSAEPEQFPSSRGSVEVPVQNYLEGDALKSHTLLSSGFKVRKENIHSGQDMGVEMFCVPGGTPAPDSVVQKQLPSARSVLELSRSVSRHLLMPASSAAWKAVFFPTAETTIS